MSLKTRFSPGPWDAAGHRFETSWLLGPWLVFAYRAIIAVYALATRFFIIGYTCTHDAEGGCAQVRDSFSYFTILTFWGLSFYFLVAAVHTFFYALGRPAAAAPSSASSSSLASPTTPALDADRDNQLPSSHTATGSLLNRLPASLRHLHSFYYTTIVTLPFLVTIVYWGILFPGADPSPMAEGPFTAWSNVSQHGLNSAFALVELLLARTAPPPWLHLAGLILILLLYLSVAYITEADSGWYVYDFLDPDEVGGSGYVAAYAVGIAVAICVIFVVAKYLIWLRVWVTEKKLGKHGKFAAQGHRDDVEMSAVDQNMKQAPGSVERA